MLNILHIIPSLSKGGAERLVLDICNNLNSKERLRIKLITFSDNNNFPFLTKNIDWKVIPSFVKLSILKKNKTFIKKLQIAIEQFKPDIIHTHLFEAEIISRSCFYPKAKWFSHCHDNMKQFQNFSWRTLTKKELFTNFYEKLLLIKHYKKCNNNFIAISKDTEKYFYNALPSNLSQNIYFLPNAISFNHFYHPEKSKHNIEKNNLIKFVTIGSLVDKKNQIFLIDVVRILLQKNYKIKLDILGDGINKKDIQKKIDEYNFQDNVFLRGNVANVEDYLHTACIYVHSATYEPFGLVLLEAMAAGLPVVCLDGKGNRDIIEQGKNGFMIDKQSAELFAEKIIELIENKKLYQSMSAFAIEFARKYDIKEYVDKLIDLYKMILK